MLAPIRRDVCMIRDLASHLNTCLVNGFSWEALSTFSAILRMLNDVFDTFELVTSGSDLKSAYAFISRQEGIVYKRVCDIVVFFPSEKNDQFVSCAQRQFITTVSAKSAPID